MKKLFLFCFAYLFLADLTAQRPDLAPDAWRADIRYLSEQLPKVHPNPFHRVSAADFTAQAAALEQAAGTKQRPEMVVGLMQLLARLGDGNARLDWSAANWPRYPLQFAFFGDELRVVAADSLYRRWLGLKVLRLNQYSLAEAQEKLLPWIPADEGSSYAARLIEQYFRYPDILSAAGLLGETYDVIMFENEEQTRIKAPLLAKEGEPSHWFKVQEEPPAHLMPPYDATTPGLWVNHLTNRKITFLYAGDYPSDKKVWKATLQQVKTKMGQNPSDRVLIDLRDNAGDNFKAGAQLVKLALKRANPKKGGKLYVAIGRHTGGAATLDALQWRQKYGVVLVGEPTGANPNGYRVDQMVALPNSGLRVFLPTKAFQVLEGHTGGLAPDHAAPPDWEAYQKGIDTVLEWVLGR